VIQRLGDLGEVFDESTIVYAETQKYLNFLLAGGSREFLNGFDSSFGSPDAEVADCVPEGIECLVA
jgi:hypothetical protein